MRGRIGRRRFRSREPTDVGGRRISKPTGLVRDSSLEIDKAPRILSPDGPRSRAETDISCVARAGKHDGGHNVPVVKGRT